MISSSFTSRKHSSWKLELHLKHNFKVHKNYFIIRKCDDEFAKLYFLLIKIKPKQVFMIFFIEYSFLFLVSLFYNI